MSLKQTVILVGRCKNTPWNRPYPLTQRASSSHVSRTVPTRRGHATQKSELPFRGYVPIGIVFINDDFHLLEINSG